MSKLILTILDESVKDEFKLVCEKCNTYICGYAFAEGMANSELLDILGIAKTQKIAIFSLVDNAMMEKFFNLLKDELKLCDQGRGVAVSIEVEDLNFINVESSIENVRGERKGMKSNVYELIVTIMDADYLELAREAVINAGAKGGTSLKGIGLGREETSKFLGISINPEKEIMLNVVKKEDKEKIMKAICDAVGVKTKGKGICFSLSVDEAIGLV